MPGQTADTPRRTDAQHARCFTQLPRPQNSFIRKGHHVGVQPPAFSGCTARKATWRGLRGRASLSDCPGHSHHLGTILVKSFPPGSHQGFHVREPRGSPRQSPAWPLWPSEPLPCQVQTHSVLGPFAVLTKPAAETMPPLSRPGPGTPRAAQMISCPRSPHLVQPLGSSNAHPPPVPRATLPLECRSRGQPEAG